jgi:hypothetical protein
MIRCPHCHRACSEADHHCRHCGTPLVREPLNFWRLRDWIDGNHALRCVVASVIIFGVRILIHPLLMPYEGDRHEGRVAAFHLWLGLAMGLVSAPLRKDSQHWLRYLIAGVLGGILAWGMDYTYMADHLLLQVVWNITNWLKGGVGPESAVISYGVLQSLRYLGPVLVLSLLSGWDLRVAVKIRILIFSLLGLAIRFPLRGFALAPALVADYPGQSALYLSSLFVFFYGLGTVDESSTK